VKATSSSSEERSAPEAAAGAKKVLVVDDSETIRQQVGRALRGAGLIVVEAADGVEALERVTQHDICVAIVDVNMPRLNGIEMVERLKADPKQQKITVLMLTTEVQQALIERAKKAGARGWMIKPVKMEQLISAVKRFTG
jgi:two-component system chemotaxis response regulator CheY